MLNAAGVPPDAAAVFALCRALERLLTIANAYTLARHDLPPSQQADLFRRDAELRAKMRVSLTGPDDPPGGLMRDENSTLLVAAIEDICGEDVDADQKCRELLASDILLEQALRRAAELATRPPWSTRVRATAWPDGLMEGLVDIWTVILGRKASSSERGPFARFAKACLELLGFPDHMTGAAIHAEYRRLDMAKRRAK